MRFSSKTSLIATTCLILNASALPYPVTYSVVKVDGGSTPTPTPTVVFQTITKSDDTPATVSVTMTAMVTDHTTQLSQATETALIPEVSASPEGHPTFYMPIPVPHPTEDSTVTVVSVVTPTPTTSTTYYDNGMWHTSYAVKDFGSASPSQAGQWTPSVPAVRIVATGTGFWHASGVAPSGSSSSYGWNSTASY